MPSSPTEHNTDSSLTYNSPTRNRAVTESGPSSPQAVEKREAAKERMLAEAQVMTFATNHIRERLRSTPSVDVLRSQRQLYEALTETHPEHEHAVELEIVAT
jgi:hypothetical protein